MYNYPHILLYGYLFMYIKFLLDLDLHKKNLTIFNIIHPSYSLLYTNPSTLTFILI